MSKTKTHEVSAKDLSYGDLFKLAGNLYRVTFVEQSTLPTRVQITAEQLDGDPRYDHVTLTTSIVAQFEVYNQ